MNTPNMQQIQIGVFKDDAKESKLRPWRS